MKKDSEVFRDARPVLLRRGLAKNALWRDYDGSVCVNGACNIAAYEATNELYSEEWQAKHGPNWPTSEVLRRRKVGPYVYDVKLGEAGRSLGLPSLTDGATVPIAIHHGADYNDCPDATLDTMCDLLERAQKLAEQAEADNDG